MIIDDYCGALCENNIFVMLSQILSSFSNQDIILQSLRIINNMCTTGMLLGSRPRYV